MNNTEKVLIINQIRQGRACDSQKYPGISYTKLKLRYFNTKAFQEKILIINNF